MPNARNRVWELTCKTTWIWMISRRLAVFIEFAVWTRSSTCDKCRCKSCSLAVMSVITTLIWRMFVMLPTAPLIPSRLTFASNSSANLKTSVDSVVIVTSQNTEAVCFSAVMMSGSTGDLQRVPLWKFQRHHSAFGSHSNIGVCSRLSQLRWLFGEL